MGCSLLPYPPFPPIGVCEEETEAALCRRVVEGLSYQQSGLAVHCMRRPIAIGVPNACLPSSIKAHSHQARLRPSTDVNALKIEPCSILSAWTDVDGRGRPSTDVYVRLRPSTDVDGRLRPSTVRLRRVDYPMASDVVARDKVMNIQLNREGE